MNGPRASAFRNSLESKPTKLKITPGLSASGNCHLAMASSASCTSWVSETIAEAGHATSWERADSAIEPRISGSDPRASESIPVKSITRPRVVVRCFPSLNGPVTGIRLKTANWRDNSSNTRARS